MENHLSGPVKRIRESFALQNAMALIKADLQRIEPGHTEIHLPHWSGIDQQHGYVHGGRDRNDCRLSRRLCSDDATARRRLRTYG